MLSKRISSIGIFIVSEMTENPTAKYEKFWCSARLLINCGFESVVVSVAPNLAVLPRTFLENNKTRDNIFISLEQGDKGRSVNSESRIWSRLKGCLKRTSLIFETMK